MRKPTVSQEDFDAWLGNPVTEAVLARMKALEASIKDFWSRRLDTETTDDSSALAFLQVELRAKLEIIRDLQGLTVSDITEEGNEDSIRNRIGRLAAEAQAAQGRGNGRSRG